MFLSLTVYIMRVEVGTMLTDADEAAVANKMMRDKRRQHDCVKISTSYLKIRPNLHC